MEFVAATITISIIATIIGYICGRDDEKKAQQDKFVAPQIVVKREPAEIVTLQARRVMPNEILFMNPDEPKFSQAEVREELLKAAVNYIHEEEYYDPVRMEHHYRGYLRLAR